MKCADCGKRIDLRKGAVMRTPLDPAMICKPCDARREATQPEGNARMNIDITIKNIALEDLPALLAKLNSPLGKTGGVKPDEAPPSPKARVKDLVGRAAPPPAVDPSDEPEDAPEEVEEPEAEPEELADAPPPRRGPPPPRVSREAVAAASAAAQTRAKPAPAPKATPASKAAPAAAARRPAPEPEPEPEEVEEEAPLEEEVEEAAPPPRAKTNGAAKPNGKGLDPRLTEAKKLKEVVEYFLDQGINDPDEMAEKCVELRAQIPVLQRISDVPTRVKRTLEVVLSGEDNVG